VFPFFKSEIRDPKSEIEAEAYLNGTSQGPTPEDARKGGHIIRARCAPLSPAPQAASATSGFPVSRSQQVIHEISGLGFLGCGEASVG
jgi:hypothetical protein